MNCRAVSFEIADELASSLKEDRVLVIESGAIVVTEPVDQQPFGASQTQTLDQVQDPESADTHCCCSYRVPESGAAASSRELR
jgi:hypothetical protein